MNALVEYAMAMVSLPKNADILDVGCLNAETLRYFKNKVTDAGRLVGIDKRATHFDSPESLEGTGIELTQMDAAEGLAFPDGSFDFVLHKNVLECISDKAAHIRELHRVLKPGGAVQCIHADWDSIAYNCENKELMSKTLHAFANWQQPWMDDIDSWIGRRLWGMFNMTGLFDGQFACFNEVETEYREGTHGFRFFKMLECLYQQAGLVSEAEYHMLKADLEATAAAGRYVFIYPSYIFLGKKRFSVDKYGERW